MKRSLLSIIHRWQTFCFEPISALPFLYFRLALSISMIPYFAYHWSFAKTWLTREGLHLPADMMPLYQTIQLPFLTEQLLFPFAIVFWTSVLLMLVNHFRPFYPRLSALLCLSCIGYVSFLDYISYFTINTLFMVSLMVFVLAPSPIKLEGKYLQTAWPTRVLQSTIVLLYFSNGVAKLFFGDWLDMPYFLWVMIDGVYRNTIAAIALESFPLWVWPTVLYLTLAFELLSPLLFGIKRLRPIGLLWGFGFQLSLALLMDGLWYFSLQLVCFYILFLSPEFLLKLSKTKALKTAVFLLIFFATSPYSESFAEEIEPGIFVLNAVSPEQPYELDRTSLALVHQQLKHADVIGLGEGMHSSAGFYEVKSAITRSLIQEKNVRSLYFEESNNALGAVQKYLRSDCSTSVEALLKNAQLREFTKAKSIAKLFRWICEFNKKHSSNRVSIYGTDIFDTLVDAQTTFSGLGFQKGNPQSVLLKRQLGSCPISPQTQLNQQTIKKIEFRYLKGRSLKERSKNTAVTSNDCIKGMDTLLEGTKDKAPLQVELAIARLRAWFLHLYNWIPDRRLSFDARDEAMAYSIVRTKEKFHPDTRAIVWAHNAHLIKSTQGLKAFILGNNPLGLRLSKTYGERFHNVALIARRVGINWQTWYPNTKSFLWKDDTVQGDLGRLSADMLLVDAGNERLQPDIAMGRLLFGVNKTSKHSLNPLTQYFDTIFWLNHSKAMSSL